MSSYQIYSVPFVPKPQLRHRYRTVKGRIFTYDPCAKEKRDLAKWVELDMRQQNFQVITRKPVAIWMWFYVYNANPKKQAYKRPDLDNLVKFLLDAINGVVFADDAQVCKISASKLYVNQRGYQRIVFAVREIEQDETDPSDETSPLPDLR